MGFNLGKLIGIAINPFGVLNESKKLVESATGVKAQKAAINEQREAGRRQSAALQSEQDKAQRKAEQERNRLNASIARANRSRKAGGLFGDTEIAQGSTSTLG